MELVVSNQVPCALFPFADPATLGRSAIARAGGILGHGTPTELRETAVTGPASSCDSAPFCTNNERCLALDYSYFFSRSQSSQRYVLFEALEREKVAAEGARSWKTCVGILTRITRIKLCSFFWVMNGIHRCASSLRKPLFDVENR